MDTATPTIIALDSCQCAACGRPYPFASESYRTSVLALLTPAELAALDAYAARALAHPDARPGDAVEAAVFARVDHLMGGRRPRSTHPASGSRAATAMQQREASR